MLTQMKYDGSEPKDEGPGRYRANSKRYRRCPWRQAVIPTRLQRVIPQFVEVHLAPLRTSAAFHREHARFFEEATSIRVDLYYSPKSSTEDTL